MEIDVNQYFQCVLTKYENKKQLLSAVVHL